MTQSPVPTSPPTTAPPTIAPTPTITIPADLCPLYPVPPGPVTVVTGPIVITEPGFYRVSTGVVNTTATVWLDVRVSNVIIDGMGQTIDGIDKDGSYGIRVRGTGSLDNITIQNLTVNDFAYGIGIFGASHSRIVRVSATSNTYDGIMVVGGGDNRIDCSVIDRDDDGINMTATTRTLVVNNIVTANVRGSGIHVSQGCDDVTLLGNIVGANDEGIEVENARNSTIRGNRIYSSRYYGLNLTAAQNLTVVDNYFNNTANVLAPSGTFSGTWNLSARPGRNVVGNALIGGNYWGTPSGTGFSDVTPDRDADGFVDGIFMLPGGIGTDSLPLGPSLSSPAGVMAAMHAVTIDSTAPDTESNQAAVDQGVVASSTSTGVEGNAATIATRETTGATATATGTKMAGNETTTTPTKAPGFGATVALVGLGPVAILVIRRKHP